MKFNNYKLEKWPLSKIWELKKDKKLHKPEWQRELKLKKNHEKRFVNSAFDGDLNDTWKFADLSSCEGFEKELKNGKKFSYEDGQHRLASLEKIMMSNYFQGDNEKLKYFLTIEVPVYVVENRTKDELKIKFGRNNSGRTIANDHMAFIEPSEFNTKIKDNLIINSKLVKNIYGIKNRSSSSEKEFYGNVIKILKVCSFYEGVVETNSTKSDSIMDFIKNNYNPKSFNNLCDLFLNQWFDIIKNSDSKDKMWEQSTWAFILHINQKQNKNYDLIRLKKIYTNYINRIFYSTKKPNVSLSITRYSAEVRYNLILKVFKDEV